MRVVAYRLHLQSVCSRLFPPQGVVAARFTETAPGFPPSQRPYLSRPHSGFYELLGPLGCVVMWSSGGQFASAERAFRRKMLF